MGYVRGTKEDMPELVDFANMVFSMSAGSIDFERLLPKAYSEERNMLAAHHLIKEEGHIKALIDVLPIELRLGEDSLNAGYIGTVSVHPKARGRKYMITLMEQAEKQAREDGLDLLILDGNRHRYQHYGFEKAGMKYCFHITGDSIRHCCQTLRQEEREYRFVLMEETDTAWLDKAFTLYQKRTVTTRTKEDFFLCLSSWEADTYAVLAGEEYVGYLNVSADERTIFEFETVDEQELPYIIKAFMEEIGTDELGIHAAMDEPQKLDLLDLMADYYTVNTSHQIKILNHTRVLRFLMKWKLAVWKDNKAMQEGSLVLGVRMAETGAQSNYSLEYQNEKVTVSRTASQADIVLEEKELVKTLTTGYYFHACQKPDSPLRKAPQGWLPLPFFLPEADAF